MELIIIVAFTDNYVIGKDNSLLWHLPNDFKRFKQVTSGYPIIMGRKTFDSIGNKALPKRENIVISSRDFENAKNLYFVKSLEQAIEKAKSFKKEKTYIIGGAQIYEQAIDLVDYLDVTKIEANLIGDSYFPIVNPLNWTLIGQEKNKKDEFHSYDYSFCVYKRNSKN